MLDVWMAIKEGAAAALIFAIIYGLAILAIHYSKED